MFLVTAASASLNEVASISGTFKRQLSDANPSECNYATHVTVTFNFTDIMNLYQEKNIQEANYTMFSLYKWEDGSWQEAVADHVIEESTESLCIVQGNYKLLIGDIGVEDEDMVDYSILQVYVTDFTGEHVVFNSPFENEIFLYLTSYIPAFESNTQVWNYISSSEHQSEYTLPTTSTSSWMQTTTFPSQTLARSAHHYFQTTFTIPSLEDLTSYSLRYRSSSALELYVNGILVYKDASDMRLTGAVTNPPYTTIIGVLNHLREGPNTLLVHLRPLPVEVSTNVLHTFNLVMRVCRNQITETMITDMLTSTPSLFNGDLADSWSQLVTSPTGEITVSWEYPEDWAVTINQLCIVNAENQEAETPSSLILSAQTPADGAVTGGSQPEGSEPSYISLAECSQIAPANAGNEQDVGYCCPLTILSAHRAFQLTMTPQPNQNVIALAEILVMTVPVDTQPFSVEYDTEELHATIGSATVCADLVLSEPLELAYVTPMQSSPTGTTPLPTGVTVNALTGQVCVDASEPSELNTSLTVTVVTDGLTRDLTLSLQRSYLSCTYEDSENQTITVPHNETITVRPCDMGYEGSVTRQCVNGVLSEENTAGCTMLPPADLQYSPAISYLVGSAITLTPTVNNLVTLFEVSPSLPAGLELHSTDGTIAGSVNEAMESTFTITASNTAGSTTYTLSLVIRWNPCEAIDGYTGVEHGEESLGNDCPENLEGETYRLCTNGVWGEIQTDRCGMTAPENLSYTSNEAYLVFATISIHPSVEGKVEEYTVSPALPEGLSLNTTTGEIHGQLLSDAEIRVMITASNRKGATSAELVLTASYPPCEASEEGVVETTGAFGSTVAVDCKRWNGVGSRQYACQATTLKVEWVMIKDGCIAYSLIGIMVGVAGVAIGAVVVVSMVMSSGKKKKVKVEVMKEVYV